MTETEVELIKIGLALAAISGFVWFKGGWRLLGKYVVVLIGAGVILFGGIWVIRVLFPT